MVDTETNSMPSSLLVAHLACFSLSFVVIKSFWEFEDASGALASYGVYHRVGWNQVIHFFGVPGILWSLLICFVHVPIPIVGDRSVNYANFMAICYTLYYFSIDPLGAALYAPFIYAMYTSAVKLRQTDQAEAEKALKANGNNSGVEWYGTGKALRFALMVHFFCWYIQIHPGHAIIEGAKPAVLTGLGSALSTAPLFAFYEGLWLLGINKGLQESTQLLVDEYTQELCTKHGIDFMRACRTLVMQE
eukprot:CAMPEP_0116103784 /NCGR_PEP_ID=MMETSP0327-20121206/14076_1 /TAXON_ID=44447 /ORGANISM="Pseudo-nitzschia delicatissima, Strain B596" /LENGTH=246 /DNA_ID=CAMNT_0003595931 /DNA_START=306 /DNA_END=1046 /DNA_ORIENTATION=-